MLKIQKFRFTSFVLSSMMVASAIGAPSATTSVLAGSAAKPAAASSSLLRIRVESARDWIPAGLHKGDSVPTYHWMIVQDDTGDASRYGINLPATDPQNSNYACKTQALGGDPLFPSNCQWPGMHSVVGGTSASVVAQGDQTTLSDVVSIDTSPWIANERNPNKGYMISVIADGYTVPNCTVTATVTCQVDGFKIGGAWFTSPIENDGLVRVPVQPYPLPLATVRMKAWNDLQTNGAYDTGEPALAGFEGHIGDVLGPILTDWYGDPICSTYQHDQVAVSTANTDATTNGFGTVTSAGPATLATSSKAWIDNQWELYQVVVTDTLGVTETRNVVANTGTGITVDVPFTIVPRTYGIGHGLMIYGSNGKPVISLIGGHCLSDSDGVISIPYLGPNRYVSTVTPPNGQEWFQTSTLEGWHDWDTWTIEGWNGYDPEFVQGAEPFPFAEFGFVQIQTGANPSTKNSTVCCNYPTNPAGTGAIHGSAAGIGEYSPQVAGLGFGGLGKQIIENISRPLVSLIDTGRNDNTVYIGRGNADGTFDITNIPDGDYVLAVWDEDQAYLLNQANVSIVNGAQLDMGVMDIAAWHSQVSGKVCFDTNRNGKCDPGEPGIPRLTLNLLDRDNKVAFYGDTAATTDNDGHYAFPRTYPLGQWVVSQGYWENYYTVGVTYQTENQPTETTTIARGGFVDVSSYNLIGHQTRMDWAVHTYESDPSLGPVTGGIVGEVVATTTRNELDARFQAVESYEPGLPGATVHLFAPVKCVVADTPPAGTACTQVTTNFGSAYYLTDSTNGSLKRLSDGPDKVSGSPIDLFPTYTSETWQRPTDCVARGYGGVPVVEQVLPVGPGHDCLEAPLMSSQVGNNEVGPFMQVNGNYGFTAIDHDPNTGAPIVGDPITIVPGDYIVYVEPPKDAAGNPAFEVVKEEDINIFSGDLFVAPGESRLDPPLPNRTPPTNIAPAIPPFPCVGPLHTVNVVDDRSLANYQIADPSNTHGVYNPDMAGAGSPYEGLRMPLCDSRLVSVRNGRSATPNFHFKTFNGFDASGTQLSSGAGVPLPGRIFGIAVDDLNLSVNPKELFYGEKYGIPNLPIGIYDFSNTLVKTIQTDPQGFYEVILPSTSSYNCPLPAGPCPGVFRFLANDPGVPGHLNPNYNPSYRTIGGFFEVWPGVSLPSDLAPTPVAFGIENPGSQQTHPAACLVNDPAHPEAPQIPELYAVSKPVVLGTDTGAARTITVNGVHFGVDGRATLVSTGGASTVLQISGAWSDNQITVIVPDVSGIAPGPYQLKITSSNGQGNGNGLTIHVLGGSGATAYNPTVYQVGPGLTGARTFDPNAAAHNTNGYEHAIQDALDAAALSPQALVVVYPNSSDTYNPLGAYYENLIIHSPLKLQGVGPGGVLASGVLVSGTVLDGIGYGTDSQRQTGWQATINSLVTSLTGIVGPNNTALTDPDLAIVPEGEVILALATGQNQYGATYKGAIDGMLIQNGDVMDFVPNVNTLGNGAQVGGGNNIPGNPNQGGGIVAFAATKNLQITNNIIKSNSGAYAGGIRLGTPLVGDNHLDGVQIANNRILNNGGTNLAGAVGIFNGAYGYEINNNDICGNFSSEYGGGISHFGLSGNMLNGSRSTNAASVPSAIHDNRIYFNGSYDEGGGILIAGEPPATLTGVFTGSGSVNIYNNIIEANLANDDGGGLRFLSAGNFPFNVYNNMIVNNISSHEGGGVAIDNAPNVRFYNNTVMKNLTTATASTSSGQPAPAGLSTASNNSFFQATLPAGSPLFSNPLLFNNIFWDNRAGTWNPTLGQITGIGGVDAGGVPDPTAINIWDIGVPDSAPDLLAPTNSVIDPGNGGHPYTASPTNLSLDPQVAQVYTTTVLALPWRGNPNFVANTIVAQDVPISIMGDYHLGGIGSSAYNNGAASKAAPSYQQPPASIAAPTFDIDRNARPAFNAFDIGADEIPNVQADLQIALTDGLSAVNAGSVVPYTITINNLGPNAAPASAVVDNFPASVVSVAWTCTAPAGSTCAVASGTGNINTLVNLGVGGSASIAAYATLSNAASGTLTNTATVAAAVGVTDPNLGNNSATDVDTIRPVADLSISVTDNVTTVVTGRSLTYVIKVSNAGPGSATNAVVNNPWPSGLNLPNLIAWQCVASTGSACNGALGLGAINRTINVAAGGSVTFTTIAATVAANATGFLTDIATVTPGATTFDPNLANNTAQDVDTVLQQADVAVAKTDNVTVIAAGGVFRYSITVSNAGTGAITGVAVTDLFPATASGISWTCSATFLSSCAAGSGTGNINTTVNLANPTFFTPGTVTFVATGVLASSATGTFANTATVAVPAGFTDTNTNNNSATDTDSVVTLLPALPTLTVLDNFNRANAGNLGASWSQSTNTSVNGNQAVGGGAGGNAIYGTLFGAQQAAGFTFANNPANNTALILKANAATAPSTYIRVRYATGNGGQVIVESTTNSGGAFAPAATFNSPFANGDTLSALVSASGTVYVYKNGTTPVGSVLVSGFTGAGRIGMQIPNGRSVDNFSGGTITTPIFAREAADPAPTQFVTVLPLIIN